MAKLKFIFEDLPNDKNRVLLSDDPLKPVIEYKGHDPYVDKAMNILKENIDKTFSFLPVERLEMDGFFQKTEGHICSTTRMSESSHDGVIDRNLIHHQYRNLFMVGSGAFPSIAPANPTLTLSALSLMAADKNF
jgi:choline dehydrogenase-like flavoprotein